MTALVFMDTETTGLALTDEVWEFAAIRREPDGTQAEHHMFIDHNPALCALLPGSFKADHQARWQPEASLNRREAARRISSIFADRPHVVGAVPNFDTERLARLLKRAGVGPGWHYHLIDVENLAVGYLAAKGIPVALPWDSDALSRACGVEPPTTERHTAMGDARWAMALYDAILSGAASTTRDQRVRELSRMTQPALAKLYRRMGGLGGMYEPEKWSTADLISSVLDIESHRSAQAVTA